jgi:hypothetical protein
MDAAIRSQPTWMGRFWIIKRLSFQVTMELWNRDWFIIHMKMTWSESAHVSKSDTEQESVHKRFTPLAPVSRALEPDYLPLQLTWSRSLSCRAWMSHTVMMPHWPGGKTDPGGPAQYSACT